MTCSVSRILLALFFVFAIGPPVCAQTPKILKLSEVKFDTEAIGFSVFRGVDPQKFNVQLRNVHDAEGFPIILSRISEGPMETPLERIGAIAGMSGSPIFVGDCDGLDECITKAPLADNDVFLVGSLSYALGYFIEDGPNAGLTPAEYMLGARLGGYSVMSQFSIRPPNKIIVDGREFQNLMLFSGINALPAQGALPSGSCEVSAKSDIKPGSMVTVFLAKGSHDVGGSGTVTWIDGEKIYIFGHPFFGTGRVSYPFTHVSVSDTLQTPFQAHKIVGCRLETEGAMLVDGMYEMAGIIGREASVLPYQVELHIGNNLVVFKEEVAESPLASAIINQLPVVWAQQFLGDTGYVSVAYQTKIAVADEPEIFMKNLIPAQVVKHPLVEVFTRTSSALEKLSASGFNYGLESIKTHIDFVKGSGVWTAKRSFLSQKIAAPGETVHVNVVLEEWSSGAVRQVSIPVNVPENFAERMVSGMPPQISVVVQSANRFVDQTGPEDVASLEDVIRLINESANRETNILYVQQVMPLAKAEREANEANAKSSVRPDWSWAELDQGALRRLPWAGNTEVVLTTTPELDHYIDFDKTFMVGVDFSGQPVDSSGNGADGKQNKKWFNYLMPWGWF